MSLPILISLEDCGDYSKTVEPFIPQLYALPNKVLENINSADGLIQLYKDANPLVTGFAASVFLSFVFLVISEIHRNYSQVDRMWSILPNLYIIHFAVWARLAGMPHSRLDLVAAFSTIWSVCSISSSQHENSRLGLLTLGLDSFDLQLLAQRWL